MGRGRKLRRTLARGGAGAAQRLREKERDLWVRLSAADQARALGDARIRPHRRFARRGWVELDIDGPDDIGRALSWLKRAHTTATRGALANDDGEA